MESKVLFAKLSGHVTLVEEVHKVKFLKPLKKKLEAKEMEKVVSTKEHR